MSIHYNENTKLFRLTTKNTEYQLKIDSIGLIQHVYYGRKTYGMDMSYRYVPMDRGFSGNAYEYRERRGESYDLLPQEFTGSGIGDYRISSLSVVSENGSRSADLRYCSHEIMHGKEPIPGLPSVRANRSEADTLTVTLEDALIGLRVELVYSVFSELDIITRRAVFSNLSDKNIVLEKASSLCIDFVCGTFDLIHFHGRHNMERQMERTKVTHDIHVIGSRRGMSSHHENPFVILCEESAAEDYGDCYGFMLMYSGNHKTEIERNQSGCTRLVMGIHDENFAWILEKGDQFYTPEVILSYSGEGLMQLSHNYHRVIRENVCDPRYQDIRRPVLINNWEATYFNFRTDKILELIKEASDLGVEMFVLDDGWFGKRDDDNSGLGDWSVNQKKLPGGLKQIADYANSLNMKFGLWFEPEMISEDSELYRTHPDWVMKDPGRKPMMSRNQMLLDMSREDVQDYLFQAICDVLDSANIEYIKWDFNRSMANVYSNKLPALRQGEVAHRFILGTYALLQKLLDRYPGLMIEGCAGGGGRFDAGMLYYCPQIWCSDDTDAIARLKIQNGTSYGYPISVVGSHVSASPNHQTGRETSLKTRGIVAMSGTFGYELDVTKLNDEEKEIMKSQIRDFHRYYWMIQKGEYYRLSDAFHNRYFTAWEFLSEDKSEVLLNIVIMETQANPQIPCVKLKGLEKEAFYQLDCTEQRFTGAALMSGGYTFEKVVLEALMEQGNRNYPSGQIYFKKC